MNNIYIKTAVLLVKATFINKAKTRLQMSKEFRLAGKTKWARDSLIRAGQDRKCAETIRQYLAMDLVVSKRSAVDRVMHENSYLRDVQASAGEAHLHIDALHAVIKTGDLKTAELLINDWEASQCPF